MYMYVYIYIYIICISVYTYIYIYIYIYIYTHTIRAYRDVTTTQHAMIMHYSTINIMDYSIPRAVFTVPYYYIHYILYIWAL